MKKMIIRSEQSLI